MTTTYVLWLKFTDEPTPRVAVFNSFAEAENCLDVTDVVRCEPPQHNPPSYEAHIFQCEGAGWGSEVDIDAWRQARSQLPLDAVIDWHTYAENVIGIALQLKKNAVPPKPLADYF